MNDFSSDFKNDTWIDSIPCDWKLNKLKYIFTEKKSIKNPFLNSGSISFGEVIYKNDEKITESTKNSYQEVLNGEFLINPLNLNFDLKSLRIGLSKINVVVSQGYIVLRINDGFHPEYYKFLLRKFDVEHMKSLGQGVRQTISYSDIKDEYLVVPPFNEQEKISQYLNKKTKKIDALIDKIETKIKVLQEQKKIYINQYITKGLDNEIEMKDAGVKWLKEIPKNWVIGKLRWFIDSIKDGTHGSHPSLENGHLLLSGKNVQNGFLKIEDQERKISLESHLEITKNGFPKKGDVLVSSVGSIGRTCVYELDEPISFQRSVCFIRPSNKIDPYFLSYLIRSNSCQEQLNILTNQSTVGGVYMSDILDLIITIPPLKEQLEIINVLNQIVNNIDLLINKHENKIKLFKEYRHSLISSIVTGKISIT